MSFWEVMLAVAGAIVVLSAAAVSVARVFRLLDRAAKRWNEFLEDWRGEPARKGYPARPGVPERLEHIEHRIDRVETQLAPTNGVITTLRESVDRIEQTVAPLSAPEQSPVFDRNGKGLAD